MKALTLRHTALAVALVCLPALGHAAPEGASRLAIATNAAAPGLGAGVLIRGGISAAQLDAQGRVSFTAEIAGTGVTAANNQAYWQDNRLLLRSGDPAPGLGGGVSLGSFTVLGGSSFLARLTGSGVTSSNDQSLWLDGMLTVRTGSSLSYELNGTRVSGTTRFISKPSVSTAGLVYALDVQDNGPVLQGPNGDRLLNRPSLWNNGKLMALGGSTAPGASGVFNGFGTISSNDVGQVVFSGTHTGSGFRNSVRQGIWRDDLSAVVLSGETPAGLASSQFISFGRLQLSNSGQVAYKAEVFNIADSTSRSGIWRDRELLALEGNSVSLPGGRATLDSVSLNTITASGAVLYQATLSDANGILRESLWRDAQLQVQSGQAARANGLEGLTFTSVSFAAATQAGVGDLLLWQSILSGGNGRALVLSDGRDEVLVARTGDVQGRFTTNTFNDVVLGTDTAQINAQGQVLYGAKATVGNDMLVTFTPTLHWRNGSSGRWEDRGAWTLGLTPGEVHDVVLDTTRSLSLQGPTGRVTLNSLTVGTGAGLVTLQMAGGSFDAADPVVIGPRGVLTGTGSFSRLVINQGTVQAERLVMSESLSNAGLVRGVAGGPRQGAGLDADLLNQASGRVLVQPGETLQLRGASHRNLGVFEINQGRLEMAGSLLNGGGGLIDLNGATALASGAWSNATGARILLGNARLTVSGGLNNAGQVLVTSGDSDVFGDLSNEKGGQIILSGQGTTTFYDGVELQAASELRTSAGATAVFFGAVAQRSGALLSGTGHKYFEGGFSVGNSPGLGEDGGDVSFGAANVYLAELGGTELGISYDHYRVAGTLTLGGTLKLASFAGFSGQAGQSFDLFDWGNLEGQFSTIDSSGLLLAEGTQLDLSRLYIDGVIGVTAVPEPAQWALMLLGGLSLLAWRRRTVRQC